MRELTEREVDLIQRLQQRPALLDRAIGREDSRLDTIRKLGASGATLAAPSLAPFLFENQSLAKAASQAIGLLLAGVRADDLVAFDRELRSRWWGVPEWRRIQPAQLLRLKVADSEAGAVFGLLSLSPNGHLREAAVRELEKVKDGAEVPFLLIRLNDWVQPVRDASRRAVLDRFRAARFSAFFDQLESVFRLEQCHREDHAVIVAAVMQSIVAKDADEHLCAALKSGSRFVRRRTYSHAMIAEGANTPRIVRLALASEDGVLRIWATRDATKVATDAELRELLPGLLADDFHPVRREALNCVIVRFATDAQQPLVDALLDRSRSIREFARFHLRKCAEFDIAGYYRHNLKRSASLLQAIAGLGECGSADDVRLLMPLLSDEPPKIRVAALRSVAALGKETQVLLLSNMTGDPSDGVAVEAFSALKAYADMVSMPELARVLRGQRSTRVVLAAVDLIDCRDVWTALPYLVEACASADAEVARVTQLLIIGKFNRVFTSPTSEQRAAILNAIEVNASSLPPLFSKELGQWLALR